MVFFISCALVCASGMSQYFLGQDFIRLNVMEQHRINSSFRAPNDFAVYLVVTIPILLSLLIFKNQNISREGEFQIFSQRLVRGLLWGLFFLALGCLGLTYSRGGWIACGVSMVILCAGNWKRMMKMVLAGLVFMAYFTHKLVKERHFIDWSNLFGFFGRLSYWQEALHMIRDHPLVGTGLNTYSIIARNYRIGWGGYPHNCYLQLTAELGIIGLLSFLWIIGALFWQGFRYLVRMPTSPSKALLWGSLSGFAGFLFQSFFDTFFYSVQLGCFMWLIMGLIIALMHNSMKSS